MINIKRSLVDLLGDDYTLSVCRAFGFVAGKPVKSLLKYATEKVEFIPENVAIRLKSLISKIGSTVVDPLPMPIEGASTEAFRIATNKGAAPLSGLGCFRIGEDGRLYLSSKSEHYHASLGHNFQGFKLLENARSIGILNATHNNSRGYITRKLERELVKWTNGLTSEQEIDEAIKSTGSGVLNRVLNISTGSLAAEAGIKLMLNRFYREETVSAEPQHAGKTPVFFVIGDYEGGRKANYHGTTFLDQLFRDMWPEVYSSMDRAEILKIVPVRINDIQDFREKLKRYQSGKYKPAGFIHEIVLMNYGVILVEQEYLEQAYALCRKHEVPIMCDEIQSGIWYPEVFTFRKYGLKPDIVTLGKGFSGGHYAASRVITTGSLDSLSQFGALVTNGQQELASLSFLITLEFIQHNTGFINDIGKYYQDRLAGLVSEFPHILDGIDGLGHMSALRFKTIAFAEAFAKAVNKRCIDISIHTYKPSCPPSALTKLPLVATREIVDWMVGAMRVPLANMLL